MSSFVGEKFVGIVYALGAVVSILALLLAPKVFSKAGGYKFLLLVTLFDILSLFALPFVKNEWSAMIILIFYFSLNTLVVFSLDELLKISSRDSSTGRTRGAYLALSSLAWVVAQLAYGIVLGKLPFTIIYMTSGAIMIVFFIMAFFNLKNIGDPRYGKANIGKYVKGFLKNKNLFRAYGISLLLQFFYSWMVIYTPIYLSTHLGFSWKEIGLIFSIMLLPFCIIPGPLGKYADKIGERKMLIFGFAIASFTTLSLFFVERHEIWIWAMLLFITRVGASTIEVMSDAYFFKHIKPENEEFVGVYRSAAPVAYIIGPLTAFIAFIFIPSFSFIYIILGAIMLFGVYLSSTIRKSDI